MLHPFFRVLLLFAIGVVPFRSLFVFEASSEYRELSVGPFIPVALPLLICFPWGSIRKLRKEHPLVSRHMLNFEIEHLHIFHLTDLP